MEVNFHAIFRHLIQKPRYHVATIVASLVALAAPLSAANDDPDTGSGPVRNATADDDKPAADALYFGQLAFGRSDIALLAQDFDDNGIPVLDIALEPDATKRLEAETLRLLDTDVTLSLGPTTLISARLVEPITEGKLRLSGRFSIPEAQAMARQMICALNLSAEQFDPPSLADKLPCNPAKAR